MKAVVAAFNQEKALVGAFSVITNLRMELFEALMHTVHRKTLLMAYPDLARGCRGLASSYTCYKLLGLDLLLDEDTRPWLLEVNTDPCLAPDPVDADLKSEMIAEMFNIVGFHIPAVR